MRAAIMLIDSVSLRPSGQDFVAVWKFANAHTALTIDDLRFLIFE